MSKPILSSIKIKFNQGEIKKYHKTLKRLILDVIFFVTLFTAWDIIKDPSTFKTDGSVFTWIIAFLLQVFIASTLAIIIITIIYTLFSPTFWGWLTTKVKKDNK